VLYRHCESDVYNGNYLLSGETGRIARKSGGKKLASWRDAARLCGCSDCAAATADIDAESFSSSAVISIYLWFITSRLTKLDGAAAKSAAETVKMAAATTTTTTPGVGRTTGELPGGVGVRPPEYRAGGDTVVSIAGERVPSWGSVSRAVTGRLLRRRSFPVHFHPSRRIIPTSRRRTQAIRS